MLVTQDGGLGFGRGAAGEEEQGDRGRVHVPGLGGLGPRRGGDPLVLGHNVGSQVPQAVDELGVGHHERRVTLGVQHLMHRGPHRAHGRAVCAGQQEDVTDVAVEHDL